MITPWRLFLLVIGIGFTCLCLHEFGHVAAAWLTGGRISGLALFSLRPHVRIAGESTPVAVAFRAAAGSAFFLCAYFVYVLLPRRYTPVRRLTLDLITCFAFVELLGWMLSCLFSPAGATADDAALFLSVSGVGRYAVAAACVVVASIAAAALRFASARPRGSSRRENVRYPFLAG